MFFFRLLPLILSITTLYATDYYVDPAGNDGNVGTSLSVPWQSLSKVNSTVFQPGDKVLFKRGGTWIGSLSPQGSGNSSAQITLSAYGEGAKPLINGNGNWAVITLSSQSYWTIDGFEVTNPASNDSSRSGIRVDSSGSGTMRGIKILNNDVHDVRGIKNVNDGGRNNGGIFLWINEPGKADDVLIRGNTVKNIYGQGIAFNAEAEYAGGGMNYTNCSPNVVARGNTVLTTSGDGILMLGTDNELVEYNEVGYVGQLSDWYNNIAAAWPTRHVNGIWQYNHVHHTAALNANDSTAFDNDGFVKGATIFQYNVSHDNAGGFLMEYTWGGDEFAQTIARYNISWNENRIFASNRNNARIYNNVFYNPGATIDVTWTPNPSFVLFSNNIFIAAGRSAEFSRQLFINNNFSGGVTRPVTIDGNRTQDPLFVSPNTTGNLAGFILQSSSLARNSGYIISDNGGKDFWGTTLPITAPHRGASQISNISGYTATPSFLRIEGADSVEIPATGSSTVSFTPTLRDQNFHIISNPNVTWSVSPALSGVSINASGTLNVSASAMPRRIAVQASNGSVVATYSVALFSNQPLSYVWGGGNGSWTDTSTAGWNGGPPVSGDHAIINSGSVNINVVGVGNLGSLTLAGGTLNAYNWNNGVNTYTAYNNLILQGGTFHGSGNYNNWGAGILKSPIVSGSSPSTISSSSFFNLNGTGTESSHFSVADVAGNMNADLIVSAKLTDVSADQNWSPAALIKSGLGTMKLTNINTYSGGTTVDSGVLELADASGGNSIVRGVVTVNAGATLTLTGGDGTGFGWSNTISHLNINGGTVNAAGGSHIGFGASVNVALNEGGTISGNWQWNGDSLLAFTSAGENQNTINGNIVMRSDGGSNHSFHVGDGASVTDLLINATLSDQYPEVSWVPASSLIKNGNGTMALTASNSYDGNTTVNAGTLRLGNGSNNSNLANAADVIVASGASLHLNYTGTDTIDELWLGGVRKSPGIYSFANSNGFITGTGTLTVINGPPSDYASWKSANNISGDMNGDDDQDGMSNFSEYAFGQNPTAPSGNPHSLQVTPANKIFTYTRRKRSLTGLNYTVWTSNNLINFIHDASATEAVTSISGTDLESVAVSISPSLSSETKLFVRISTTTP
jgi:autotransporter-associated beta strand protein